MKSFKLGMALLAALALVFAAGCSDDGTDVTIIWDAPDADGNWWVKTEEGLLAWAAAAQEDLSTSCNLGGNITLTSEDGWTPIGTRDSPYTGTFDGGNYTISNVNVSYSTSSSAGNFAGFFGCIGSEGIVQDLNLVVSIEGYQYIGGLAGRNEGTISGCSSIGSINAYGYGGGLVGFNTGEITDSYSACDVERTSTSSSMYTGGFVGHNIGGSITGCYATGDVTGRNYAGGFAGGNGDASIIACYATGDVTGDSYVGGFAGINSPAASITGCYAAGSVEGTGSNIGGFVGYYTGTVSINTCYWSNEIGSGIGGGGGTGDVVLAGENGTAWATAASNMNAVISGWQYEVNSSGEPPLILNKL